MQTFTNRHYMSQPLAAAGTAPEWIHLIPAGTFTGADGRGPFVVKNAAALIATSMANGKLVLDENHSTDTAAKVGQPAPARGWIVELQARDDGIWGRMDWNDAGRQMMADRSYRGVSPVFINQKDGEVVQLLRAALTNEPNLDLHPLHHQESHAVDLSKMRKALGLAETADEAAILAAVEAQAATVTQHAATIAAHNTQVAAIATAAGLAPTLGVDGLVTQLQAVRASAGSTERMAAQIVGLETQLNALKAEGAQAAAAAFIDGVIKSGKPIASLRDHYVTRHIADAAAVEKEVNAMVSINAGGMPAQRHDDSGSDGLSQEEMSVCKAMNLDPKKFAEQKKKKGG